MATGAGYSYQYDNNGNRIAQWVNNNGGTETSPQEGDTNITIYTWDFRNRMTSVTTYASYDAWKGIGAYSAPTPTQTVTYTYDIFNRWLGETVTDGSGTVTVNRKFVYDNNQIVLQFDSTAAGDLAAANLSHRYLYGPAVDQVLADEQVSSLSQPGNVVWPLADNQGTICDLAVQNSGVTSIATHRVYNAFGVLESQTNAAVDCVFGYAGGVNDAAPTGEEYFDNRWYEAVTGRWLSQDPIAADVNLYRYCGNNPVIMVDPSGMATYTQGSWIGTQQPAWQGQWTPNHEFVFTTDPNGNVTTYSWGNNFAGATGDNGSHWFQNDPNNVAAARNGLGRLQLGNIGGPLMGAPTKVGGNSLDPFIQQAFNMLHNAGANSPSGHGYGKLSGGDCKDEKARLLALAQALQAAAAAAAAGKPADADLITAQGMANAGIAPTPPTVTLGVPAGGPPPRYR